jgi:hypothetical protein
MPCELTEIMLQALSYLVYSNDPQISIEHYLVANGKFSGVHTMT